MLLAKTFLNTCSKVYLLCRKITTLGPFFKTRRRLLVERVSQTNFYKNVYGETFKNSKWVDYSKSNINKIKLQQAKKLFKIIIFLAFLILLIKSLISLNFINYLISVCSYFNISLLALKTLSTRAKLFIDSKFENISNKLISLWLGPFEKNTKQNLHTFTDTIVVNTTKESTPTNNPDVDQNLILIKKMFDVSDGLCKLNHEKCIKSLKKLVNRTPNLSYGVSTQDLELKTLEIWTNVETLAMSMDNDKKYKNVHTQISTTMLNPKYNSFQMCKEAGIDDKIINTILSSEFTENKTNSATTELDSFNEFTKNYTNVTKIQRVLFKNTILHNQTLKSMNWVTNSKKLLMDFASTFDSKENNIWIANHLIQNSNKVDFIKNIKNIYGDYNNRIKNKHYKTTVKNHIDNNVPTNLDFVKLYEESFFWILKHAEYFDSMDSKLTRLNIKNMKNRLDTNNSLVEFLFLFAKLKNNYTFLKNEFDTELSDSRVENFIKEAFYQTPDKELFDKEVLANLYEIINNKTDDKSTYYYYKLSNYDSLLLPDLGTNDVDFSTDWEATKKLIKSQPAYRIHTIDIIEREYLKNYYRLFIYLLKLINSNNNK